MKKRATYASAGVGLNRAGLWTRFLKRVPKKSRFSKYLTSGIGGFASALSLPTEFGSHPLILSTCDGVGTKLAYPFPNARALKTLGWDLVGMSVNDIAASGGTPVFFLDYLACGYLNQKKYSHILAGIAEALAACNTLLVGGETAEMPQCYKRDDFDLAGFCVGLVHPKKIFKPHASIRAGDHIIGLPSSGVHSNGFSLIHHIFTTAELKRYAAQFLKPTTLYAPLVTHLQSGARRPKGAAHITGGGLCENIPRILPKGLAAEIDTRRWKIPRVFSLIQTKGHVTDREMFRTYNMGIGFVVVVSRSTSSAILARCKKFFPSASLIGQVIRTSGPQVILR